MAKKVPDKRNFYISQNRIPMKNRKIKLHTDSAGSAQGCHKLDISQKTGLAVCNKGNLPTIADSIIIIPQTDRFVN